MEFMNRGGRPTQPASTPASSAGPSAGGSRNKKGLKAVIGLKAASVALLFAATILVVAMLWFVVLGSPNSEARSVDTKKMQAVFLNGGQVYFGNIKDLNGSYMRVSNIYYLRVNQQVQPDQQASTNSSNDISLVKLGCELHGPTDEMLINRDQVVFWENLKTDGQVAKAVAEYQKQNPKGQDCSATQSQSTTPASTDNKQ
jgi:hypothetical protein